MTSLEKLVINDDAGPELYGYAGVSIPSRARDKAPFAFAFLYHQLVVWLSTLHLSPL
jgi:hypothetical protein